MKPSFHLKIYFHFIDISIKEFNKILYTLAFSD